MVVIDESSVQATVLDDNLLALAVDAEHTGIRAVGCTTLIGSTIVLFFLAGFVNLPAVIALIGSIVLAAALSYGLEKYLKQRWPSGRELHLSNDAITISKKQEVERSIDPQQQVNVLTWHFEVKRNTRVKKGWCVVGMSLEQDGELIPVYTFAAPDDFEKMPLFDHFVRLQKADKDEKEKTKSVTNMRRAGEQRRLHEAEYDRSIFGAELTLPQFITYLEFLQKNYPKWMIS
jgi:hypothetical protein